MDTESTSKSLLTSLNIIYFSIVMVMLSFSMVVLFLNYSGGISSDVDADFSLIMRYALIGLLPAGLGIGYFIFKQMVGALGSTLSLKQKLFRYQTALLIRSACFELPGLLGCVAALITNDNTFLLFTGIVIAIFFLFRPTIFSITTDLNLSQAERSILENPLSPIN